MIPISPNTDDIKDYVGMRLDRDIEPEAMNDDLWADIVRIILGNISDMCVGAFRVPTVPTIHWQRLCAVSSLFRHTLR